MKPSIASAAKRSAFLCILFLIVYGSCNIITSYRTDVPSFYFEWERNIPFIEWMIIPYMSIDLFFIAAPFICRTEKDLSLLTKRITFTIVTAGMFFLICPLTFGFERPAANGWLGLIFNNFRKLDLPYNQLPSLHIVLRTILALAFTKHSHGLLRILSAVWFSLIGFSTIFTHQHHVIDVIGGFILALFSFYLFPDSKIESGGTKNVRVGFYYGFTGAFLIVIGLFLTPINLITGAIGFLLFWPGLSLILISWAYLGGKASVYRKTDGKIPISSKLIHLFSLFAQKLSLLYYSTKSNVCDEIIPRLLIGRQLSDSEAAELIQKRQITAVLDLTSEFSEAAPFLKNSHPNFITYLNIPILDLTAPTQKELHRIVEFIELHHHKKHGTVYIHCKAGYSRSAAAAGAYLLASKRAANFQEIKYLLRKARPAIIIRPEIKKALDHFGNGLL